MNQPARDWCCASAAGTRLTVHIQPNASTTAIVGVHGDALKIRLQAQPIEGRANDSLVRALAGWLGLPRSAVVLSHGLGSRHKVLELRGANAAAVRRTMLAACDRPSEPGQ